MRTKPSQRAPSSSYSATFTNRRSDSNPNPDHPELRAAKEIREKYPDTSVLVLSQYAEEGYALELLQENAEGVGYLLKDGAYDLADFVAAVKRVAEGGSALDSTVVSQLVGRRRRDDPLDELTAREREVLELMAEGLSNSAIAARVFLTDSAELPGSIANTLTRRPESGRTDARTRPGSPRL